MSWIFDSLEAKHHISLTPVKCLICWVNTVWSLDKALIFPPMINRGNVDVSLMCQTFCSRWILQMWVWWVYRCFSDTTRARLLCCRTKLWIMKICRLSRPAGSSTSALKERTNLESCFKAPEAKRVDQTRTVFSREESFSRFMLLNVLEETVSFFTILPVGKFNWNSGLNLAFWNEESSLKCRAAVRFVSHCLWAWVFFWVEIYIFENIKCC